MKRGERGERGAVVTTASGTALVVLGTFRPWVASGTTERSSYELVGLADRLGATGDGAVTWVLRGWPLVPLALVLATVALAYGWTRLGVVLGVVVGLTTTLVALAVARAPGDGVVRPLAGPTITAAGGAVLLSGLGVAAALSATGRARRVRHAARTVHPS